MICASSNVVADKAGLAGSAALRLHRHLITLCCVAFVTAVAAPAMATPRIPDVPGGLSTERSVRSSPALVRVSNGAKPGALEIRATKPMELAPDLIVERQREDGAFEIVRNLDLGSMHLVAACSQPTKRCVRVDSRGLRPVPWSGMTCSAQCTGICDRNVRLHGRYRFVVTTCKGHTRYEGPVFTLS